MPEIVKGKQWGLKWMCKAQNDGWQWDGVNMKEDGVFVW